VPRAAAGAGFRTAMASTDLAAGAGLVAADGTPLAKKLAYTMRRSRRRAFAVVLPALLFLIVFFVVPIAQLVDLSVRDDVVSAELPRTAAALAGWDGKALPGEAVFAALVEDLKAARERQATGRIGARLNHVYSGARSLFVSAGRRADSFEAPFRRALLDHDAQWGDLRLWAHVHAMAGTLTSIYYWNAVDRTLDERGAAVPVPAEQRIHLTIFWRTLWLSALVTSICLLLGYPVAYLLASLPLRISNLLMICVLLPFWTALLVRITAWIALLQNDGVVLSTLVYLGLVDPANRPQLIYNLTGTLVAMVHVLLPLTILPLYSVMKTIPASYVRAARSLGASSWTAFRQVYLPQTVPGIAAGTLLVFILAVGYYITPALLGGQDGVLISNFIALHMEKTLNWGLAAALGGLLLVAVLVLYWLFNRLVGIERLKMG
jgi:putative spermidine/putrescine transport system permease protein